MYKIRRGDTVQIIKGKDSGKRGKVLIVFPEGKRVIVEGLNLVKKHKRQTRQDEQKGIVSIEAPISISNLMLYCKNCNRGVRSGFTFLTDKTKSRICRVCKGVI
jgi:large subunit ribosomal protein L24